MKRGRNRGKSSTSYKRKDVKAWKGSLNFDHYYTPLFPGHEQVPVTHEESFTASIANQNKWDNVPTLLLTPVRHIYQKGAMIRAQNWGAEILDS